MIYKNQTHQSVSRRALACLWFRSFWLSLSRSPKRSIHEINAHKGETAASCSSSSWWWYVRWRCWWLLRLNLSMQCAHNQQHWTRDTRNNNHTHAHTALSLSKRDTHQIVLSSPLPLATVCLCFFAALKAHTTGARCNDKHIPILADSCIRPYDYDFAVGRDVFTRLLKRKIKSAAKSGIERRKEI